MDGQCARPGEGASGGGGGGGGGGGELRLGEIELARVVSGSGWTGRGEGGNPVEEGGEGWHGRDRREGDGTSRGDDGGRRGGW